MKIPMRIRASRHRRVNQTCIANYLHERRQNEPCVDVCLNIQNCSNLEYHPSITLGYLTYKPRNRNQLQLVQTLSQIRWPQAKRMTCNWRCARFFQWIFGLVVFLFKCMFSCPALPALSIFDDVCLRQSYHVHTQPSKLCQLKIFLSSPYIKNQMLICSVLSKGWVRHYELTTHFPIPEPKKCFVILVVTVAEGNPGHRI